MLEYESKIVSDPLGNKVHVIWAPGEVSADDNAKYIQPADIPSGAGRWVVITSPDTSSSASSAKIDLASDLLLTFTSPDVILLTPDNDDWNVSLPSLANDSYKTFKLINLSNLYLNLLDDASVIRGQLGGGGGAYPQIAECIFIEDEWFIEFRTVQQ